MEYLWLFAYMKKSIFLYLIFAFSIIAHSQTFNIVLGKNDPYVDAIFNKALPFQDSQWIVSLYNDRYTFQDRIFYYTLPLLNLNGEKKEEFILGDTTNFYAYLDWIKSEDSYYKILVKDYTLEGDPYYDLQIFNSELVKLDSKIISFDRPEIHIESMKELSDTSIIFCGYMQYYNKIQQGYEESQAIIYKLDSQGNELWHVEYGDSLNYEKFYDFTVDNEGNIFAIGQWIEPYFDGDFQALLVKYDKNGKLLWSKLYGDENSLDYFTVINMNKKGDLVINGGWGHNTNKFFFDKYYGRMGYYIVDTSGVMQLSKEYQQYGSDIYDCVKDANDNLICAGQTYEPDDKSTSGIIVKFNSVGDTIWTRYYNNYVLGKRRTARFSNIVYAQDSGYIITGTKLYDFGFAPQLNSQGWVVKVDSLGYDHTTTWPVTTQEPIASEQEPVIRFYPNPTSGDLFYRYRDVYMIERNAWVVSFYDLQGREVKTFEMSPFTNAIHLSSLPDGVYPYIIRTKKHEFVISGKVVVDRR